MAADLKTALLIALQTTGEERVAKLRQALVDLGISADKAEDLAAGLDTELKQLADSSGKAEKKSMDLAGALKTVAGAAIVREFIQANASFESMSKSLEMVTGSSAAAKAEMEFVRAESMRLGLEVTAAASSYVQLAASAKGTALEGQATRDIWSAVAESMARLGKSTADTDGALMAISQMMSKGVVSAEELRGQLGERLPGAFQTAATAMGTTTQGLGEMLEKGEIVAADFLPKFAAELSKTGGGEVDTFNANLARLKNTFTDVFLSIGDTGAFEALSGGLKYVSVAVVRAWEGFELLGKALGNLAYTIATLDFSGYQARQKEALAAARADVEKVIERLFPLKTGLEDAGKAGKQAGNDIAQGAKQADAEIKVLTLDAKQAADGYKDWAAQIQSSQKVRSAENNLAQSAIQIGLAEQKGLYDLSKATGNTSAAKEAKNKITALEIELSKLVAQQAIAEAEATFEVAKTKLKAAEATGEGVKVAKDELRIAEIGVGIAKNKLVLVEANATAANKLANASSNASGAIGDMGGSMAATGGAAQNLTRDIEELTAAEQHLADVRDAANAARGQGGATNWEYLLGSKGIKLSTEQLAAFKSQIQSVYDYLSGTFDGKVVSSTYLLNEALDRTVAQVKNGTGGGSGSATASGGASASGGTSTNTSTTTRASGVNLTINVSGPTDTAALARLIVPEIDKITRWRA